MINCLIWKIITLYFCITDYFNCVHENHVFNRQKCPFGIEVKLKRCTISSVNSDVRDSDYTNDVANTYSKSQNLDDAKTDLEWHEWDGDNSYSQSQDSDDAKIENSYSDSDNEVDNR